MRSRLALGPSTPAGGSGLGPNRRSTSALTAPRGERLAYAETERREGRAKREGNPKKDAKRERKDL